MGDGTTSVDDLTEQQVNEVRILDVACGSRMFWFDKSDPRAVFCDIRNEQHTLCDGRSLNIAPDCISDFASLPFKTAHFSLVVFDPPHLVSVGKDSWLRAKYGELLPGWQGALSAGFRECFRVLKPGGMLIFKWNELQVKVSEILALTDHKPLFGHRSGKASKTHWITFMKPDTGQQGKG